MMKGLAKHIKIQKNDIIYILLYANSLGLQTYWKYHNTKQSHRRICIQCVNTIYFQHTYYTNKQTNNRVICRLFGGVHCLAHATIMTDNN